MTLNISARHYRVWVCKPHETPESGGLEVTEACSGDTSGFFTATDEALGDDGRIRTTGSLVLAVLPGNEALYDPWNNSDRWQAGNHIIVQVADQAGTLRPHPRSNLYIISPPLPPYPGNNTLKLELGDALTLAENRDASSTTTVSDVPRANAANGLLASIGVPGNVTIGGTNPPKSDSSSKSPVQQIGEMALANCKFVYGTAAGSIDSRPVKLHPDRRLFKHRVGVDDAADFEPIQNVDRPNSDVQVQSSGEQPPLNPDGTPKTSADDNPQEDYGAAGDGEGLDAGSIVSLQYSDASAVAENVTGSVLSGIRIEKWAWQGNVFTRSIEEQSLRGLVVAEAVYNAIKDAAPKGTTIVTPDPFSMVPSLVTTENHVYEAASEGRLLYTETTSSAPLGSVFGDFYQRYPPNLKNTVPPNFLGMLTAGKERTDYEYKRSADDTDKQSKSKSDTGGQVRRILTTKQEPIGKVAGSANDWAFERNSLGGKVVEAPRIELGTLITSSEQEQTWKRRSTTDWEQRDIQRAAGQARSGPITSYIALATTQDQTTVSGSGNAQPPSANRRRADPGARKLKKIVKAKVKLRASSGSSLYPSSHTVQNDYLNSKSEAIALATMLANLRAARQRGFRITSALRDEWFSYAPMARVDLDWNGLTYVGFINTCNWTLAANQAIVLAECCTVGRVPGEAGTPDTYPFPDLPNLEPTDPDPEPIDSSGVIEPGDNLTQPIAPYYQRVQGCYEHMHSSATATGYNYPIGVQPTTARSAHWQFRARAGELVQAHWQMSAVAGAVPNLNNHWQFVATATAAPALTNHWQMSAAAAEPVVTLPVVAFWHLEGTPWTDSSGNGHTLTQVGLVSVVSGVSGNAARFQGGGLRSSDSQLAGNDKHWRFECYLKLTGAGGICAGWSGFDWDLTFSSVSSTQGSISATLYNSPSLSGSNTTIDATSNYAKNVWLPIVVEMLPDTGVFKLTVNGDEYSTSYSGVTFRSYDQTATADPASGETFFLGLVNGLQMDEAKFSKES